MKRIVAIAFVLAACGGDDHVNLTGMYMVTVDVASMPCGTDQAVLMAPAYLKFTQMELFGQKYYQYDGCTDAAGTMCDGSGNLFNAFTEPTSTGWKGETTSWSAGGGTCSISYSLQTATLKTKMLVIESEQHEGSETIPDAQCVDAEAKRAGPTLTCTAHEHIEATKL